MIDVKDLQITIGNRPIIHHANFTVKNQEIIGIVGASGSGKSMMMKALMGLLPYGAQAQGQVRYDDGEYMDINEMHQSYKGHTLCMLPQDSINGLHPYKTLETQMEQTFQHHHLTGGREKIQTIFNELGLPKDERFLSSHARSLSGGMRQRVAIALCLAANPDILIADEPTTSLDAINQLKFITILKKLHTHHALSLLVVSHNIALVAQIAQQLWVVHQGTIIESGPTKEILEHPQEVHTKTLVEGCKRLYGGIL